MQLVQTATEIKGNDSASSLGVTRNSDTTRRRGVLRQLGLVGLDSLEPVILAAIATETPLLLIGPHGTAKSLLLSKLCEALRISWRHYNASLVNYDDLVGYPLPDASGKLSFVQTPASIWDAQAVFIDELSRARPDMLNRLFPIIHEKKVQGIALPRLQYRWAAMNPSSDPSSGTGENYVGSEPLDPALADRFGFVVIIPSWGNLTPEDQSAVITSCDTPVTDEISADLIAMIAEIRNEIEIVRESFGGILAQYVRTIAAHTQKLNLPLSSRRAAMLYRNLLAVHATYMVCATGNDLADTAWSALLYSLPHRADGIKIDNARLLIAHNETWKTLKLEDADPRRMLALEQDPVKRALRATQFSALPIQDFSSYVADALASLPVGGRHALAVHLMESGAAGRVLAAVAEQLADLYKVAAVAQDIRTGLVSKSRRHEAWDSVVACLSSLARTDPEEPYLRNLLPGLFMSQEISDPADAQLVRKSWDSVRRLCALQHPREAA